MTTEVPAAEQAGNATDAAATTPEAPAAPTEAAPPAVTEAAPAEAAETPSSPPGQPADGAPEGGPAPPPEPPAPPDVDGFLGGLDEEQTGALRTRLLGDLDDEALSDIGPFKSLLSRREEGARQSAESETARQLQQREVAWAARGDFTGELQQLLASAPRGEDGSVTLDPTAVSGFTDRLWAANTQIAYGALSTAIGSALPEVEIPTARLTQLEGLRDRVLTGAATAEEFVAAQLDLLKFAAVQESRAGIRTEIEGDLRKEQASAETVEQRQQAQAARNGAGTATQAEGGPAGGPVLLTAQDWDNAHVSGAITTEQYMAKRYSDDWIDLPLN